MKIIRHPTSNTTDRLQALEIMHVPSKMDEEHVTKSSTDCDIGLSIWKAVYNFRCFDLMEEFGVPNHGSNLTIFSLPPYMVFLHIRLSSLY